MTVTSACRVLLLRNCPLLSTQQHVPLTPSLPPRPQQTSNNPSSCHLRIQTQEQCNTHIAICAQSPVHRRPPEEHTNLLPATQQAALTDRGFSSKADMQLFKHASLQACICWVSKDARSNKRRPPRRSCCSETNHCSNPTVFSEAQKQTK
jgi:hypothetical protein